jgi:apolipoprotein N-acyltransferase
MAGDPYLWLGIGGLLSIFASGRWTIAAAGWLAPLFLLHYANAVPAWPALIGLWLAAGLALGIGNWRVIPVPVSAYPFVALLISAPSVLPYLADRLLAPSLPGFLSTLVFPAAWTALEYLGALSNPFGTWGSLAYTQAGNRPLLQLASVTGLWGIVFVLTWCASVVNWVWQSGLNSETTGTGLVVFGSILASVLIAGRVRLNQAPATTHNVRVATVGWPEGILDAQQVMRAFAPALSTDEQAALRTALARVHEHFIAKTADAVRAGAKIVVWPEANIVVYRSDESAVLTRLRALAREHDIYLLVGMAVLDVAPKRSFENRAMLFDPTGSTALRATSSPPRCQASRPRLVYAATAVCPWLIRPGAASPRPSATTSTSRG